MTVDWVTIDFETANYSRSSICSVGMTAVENNKITDRFTTLIRPPDKGGFAAFNMKLHGITPDAVVDAPTWPEALARILTFAEGRSLVAHNAAFDFGALRDACSITSMTRPDLRYACSLVIARQTWKLLSYRLPFVAEAAGVPMRGPHHDAQEDADTTARVVIAAMSKHRVDNLDDLLRTLQIQYGRQYSTSDSWNNCRHRTYEPRTPIPRANPNADPEGALYGRTVCLTGTLSTMTRAEAQERLADVGAQATASVGLKTDLLVLGTADPSRFAPGMTLSSKHRRAQELLDAGHTIEVISEAEFLELLSLSGPAVRETQAPPADRGAIPDATRDRYVQLSSAIAGHRFSHYVNDLPQITDAQFDELVTELAALETEYPDFRSS
jgi:DNA polymerase-3 subunit epsilon